MKKLNALLHDVTIINFSLVAKLIMRYRKVSIGCVMFSFLAIGYFYLSQSVVHQKQVNFKVFSHEDKNVLHQNGIANLILNAGTVLKKPEVLAIITTYSFTSLLAENVLSDPNYRDFDFRSPFGKEKLSNALENCKSEECRKNVLRGLIPNLFTVEAEMGTDRFVLTVNTRSTLTTLGILRAFQISLETIRYQEVVSSLEKNISQLEDLIAKTRHDIEAKGGFEKVAMADILETSIAQYKEKIRALSERLNKEKDQVSFQKIRLQETNLTARKEIEGGDKLAYETFSKTKRRIDDLRLNIASISSAPVKSPTDEAVLGQLKRELIINEAELKKMGDVKRNLAHDDSFINTQITNQTNFEFDYKVAGAKLKTIERDFQQEKAEFEKMLARKAAMDSELIVIKPDLEYLKLLEGKLISMKLKKSSADADVHFEHHGTEVIAYKRNSFIQVFLFFFALTAFLLFVLQIIIYLSDDKIYDEFEIAKCCEDLPVIGNVPSFDS